MLPLTTPFSVTNTSSSPPVGHYAQSSSLLSQYNNLFPYTYGQTTAGLIVTSSSSDDTQSEGSSQRTQLPIGSSYPYMYQSLGSGIASYYSQNNESNGILNNPGAKHQSLLPVFGHFPLPNLSFPSQTYTNQTFSPFMNVQYLPTKAAVTENSTATNNSYVYSQFPFTKQNSFLSAAGTTQIYPPGPGNSGASTSLLMDSVNTNDTEIGIQNCPQINLHGASKRETDSSSSHHRASISTPPISGIDALQSMYDFNNLLS